MLYLIKYIKIQENIELYNSTEDLIQVCQSLNANELNSAV